MTDRLKELADQVQRAMVEGGLVPDRINAGSDGAVYLYAFREVEGEPGPRSYICFCVDWDTCERDEDGPLAVCLSLVDRAPGATLVVNEVTDDLPGAVQAALAFLGRFKP